MGYPKVKEAEILKACLDWLEWKGYTAWRMPISPVMRGGGQNKLRFSPSPLKGFPDICGILNNFPGRLWACELKTPSGKLSEDQRIWIDKLSRAGVVAIVARSLEEMISALYAAESGRR